ncbi:MAG: response regulator [Thermodesulfobacteriota bacterium]
MGIQALIVDDSAAMRSVIKKILSLSGAEVSGCLEAADGREALDILSRHWVDVILTDIHMPVMTGTELLERIQQDETLRRIPVVLVTTESRREIIERAAALGARAHVRKPFQPETIRRVLEAVLGEEFARGTAQSSEGSDF